MEYFYRDIHYIKKFDLEYLKHKSYLMSRNILSLLLVMLVLGVSAQSTSPRYWILLKDKPTENYDYREHLSPEAIKKRELMNISLEQYSDIPLNENYLNSIDGKGIKIQNQSKWLNGVSATLTSEQKAWLQKQDFVKELVLISTPYKTLTKRSSKITGLSDGKRYSTAISQMEATLMEEAGLTAEGIIIGVIDAGFYGLSKNKNLKHLLKEEKILGSKDFVDTEREDLFNDMATYSDDHGTQVVEHIAGIKVKGPQFGFAVDASFYLARSEKGDTETRAEEDYWIRAMEWMDSLGVRIINTSLGYAMGFDDPKQNYELKDMNGKTAIISKAAQIASEDKGLLLIVSAGNEGNDAKWQIVSAPADAKGVLSVGATGPGGLKAGYSSIGPDFLPYLKPNVACYSLMGTSFSAPVITGFAACLFQYKPAATGIEIKEIIEKSGHLYPFGNNYLGYGVPKTSTALNLLEGKDAINSIERKNALSKNEVIIKMASKSVEDAVIFHKRKQFYVNQQVLMKPTGSKYKIKKPNGTTQSTFICGDRVIEIVW